MLPWPVPSTHISNLRPLRAASVARSERAVTHQNDADGWPMRDADGPSPQWQVPCQRQLRTRRAPRKGPPTPPDGSGVRPMLTDGAAW
eukprot:624843-Prymnesium_polylepis.1